MKNYFLLIATSLFALFSYAQTPCDLDEPPGCYICGSSYHGTTSGFTSDSTDYDFPCPEVENSLWFNGIAKDTEIAFDFYGINCSSGSGLEVVLYNADFQPVSGCQTIDSNSGTVSLQNAIPGETYYVIVDGMAGAFCDFNVLFKGIFIPAFPRADIVGSAAFIFLECGGSHCISLLPNEHVTSYDWEISGAGNIISGGSPVDSFVCLEFDGVGGASVLITPLSECSRGPLSIVDIFIEINNDIIIDTVACPGECVEIQGTCYYESENVNLPHNCGTISRINITPADTSDFKIDWLLDSFIHSIAFNWSGLGADSFDIFIDDVFQIRQAHSSFLYPFTSVPGNEVKIKVVPFNNLGCDFKTAELVAKLPRSTGLSEKTTGKDLKIFPNPTKGRVEIQAKNRIEKLSVFDLSGKSVLEGFENNIDLSNEPSGIYFLKIETKEGFFFEKVINL